MKGCGDAPQPFIVISNFVKFSYKFCTISCRKATTQPPDGGKFYKIFLKIIQNTFYSFINNALSVTSSASPLKSVAKIFPLRSMRKLLGICSMPNSSQIGEYQPL